MPLLPLQNLPTGNFSNTDVAVAATAASSTTNTTHTTSSSKSNLNNSNDDIENILTMSHDDVSPPLVFPAEYKAKILFWFHFVKYPLIFIVVNIMIFYFVFFMLRLTVDLSTTLNENNDGSDFTVVRPFVGILSVLSFVDVTLIYHYAIRVLETPTVPPPPPQNSSETHTFVFNYHVNDNTSTIGTHAKVSKKIDEILGRDVQRPGGSFLAAITWLVFIGVGTYGCTCSALFVLMGVPLFRRVCSTDAKSVNQMTTHHHDLEDNYNNAIEHIPDELQEWAKMTHAVDENFGNTLVHLASGWTYSAMYDVSDRRTKLSSNVTTANDGQLIQMHSNVNSPFLLTGFTSTDEHHLNDVQPGYESFCCLYLNFAEPSEYGRTKAAWFDYSILCIPPSSVHNNTNSFGNEIFPNVTLHRVMVPDYPNELFEGQVWNHLSHYDFAISGASIILSSSNELWVQLSYVHDLGPYNERSLTFEFYKIYMVDDTVMEKKFVNNVTFARKEYGNPIIIVSDPHHETKPICEITLTIISSTVILLCLVAASAYLTYAKRLSISILPMYSIVIILMSATNNYLLFPMILDIASLISFLGLLGVISVSLGREQLCLILYTTLLLHLLGMFETNNYYPYDRQTYYLAEEHIFTLVVAAIIGFIFDHPVLYLSGWILGIYSVLRGVLSLLLFDSQKGLVMMGLGAVIGCGSVTIGSHIITYRSYILYNLKRLCFLLKNAIQQRMAMNQQQQHDQRQQQQPLSHPEVSIHDTTSCLLDNDEWRTRND